MLIANYNDLYILFVKISLVCVIFRNSEIEVFLNRRVLTKSGILINGLYFDSVSYKTNLG